MIAVAKASIALLSNEALTCMKCSKKKGKKIFVLRIHTHLPIALAFSIYNKQRMDTHSEVSTVANEIPEETGEFRFLRVPSLGNIEGSVGLILAKTSDMRISIPIDLSSRPFIPLPCFNRSRRPTTLLAPSLVFSPLCSA